MVATHFPCHQGIASAGEANHPRPSILSSLLDPLILKMKHSRGTPGVADLERRPVEILKKGDGFPLTVHVSKGLHPQARRTSPDRGD
jgi:hypothetical protein